MLCVQVDHLPLGTVRLCSPKWPAKAMVLGPNFATTEASPDAHTIVCAGGGKGGDLMWGGGGGSCGLVL